MWVDIFSHGSVTIRVASAELLLAMKLKVDRGLRDREDIQGLLKVVGVTNLQDVQEIYEKFNHQEVLSEQTCQLEVGMLSSS